jgi:catechol 2,3-dioxygenase-like lactoylglutathione lyase family enzyme
VAKARLVGINHVALEVGDLDRALEVYGALFDFELRGRVPGMAFLDMGDQFLALSEGRAQAADDDRHFGLVVDDPDAVRAGAAEAGFADAGGRGLNIRDPWGNLIQVVAYAEVQFERSAGVRRKLGIEGLEKTESARAEIVDRGLG